MQTSKKIELFLKKPFPLEESKFEALKIITVISVFVALFLYLFRPFGLHLLESRRFLFCLGFGGVTFVASAVYEFIAVPVLRVKRKGANFTFGKWIFYMVGAALFISLANFLFVRVTLFGDIQWALFPAMFRATLAIGIFPVVALGALALRRQEKKYQGIAEGINKKAGAASTDRSEDQSPLFGIARSRIRYVEALQNYVKIGHIDNNGQPREQIERATLKSILAVAEGGSVVRCHRSFLVNRDSITSTSGNAQGLLLSLLDCERQVPVSRSFVSVFRDR